VGTPVQAQPAAATLLIQTMVAAATTTVTIQDDSTATRGSDQALIALKAATLSGPDAAPSPQKLTLKLADAATVRPTGQQIDSSSTQAAPLTRPSRLAHAIVGPHVHHATASRTVKGEVRRCSALCVRRTRAWVP
jgi:hypothetical protein